MLDPFQKLFYTSQDWTLMAGALFKARRLLQRGPDDKNANRLARRVMILFNDGLRDEDAIAIQAAKQEMLVIATLAEVEQPLNDNHLRLAKNLECPFCRTIYLNLKGKMQPRTPIHCSSCGMYVGSWAELEAAFNAQGGNDGVFQMDRGQIFPIA